MIAMFTKAHYAMRQNRKTKKKTNNISCDFGKCYIFYFLPII